MNLGLTGRRLALRQDPNDQETFMRQLLSECNVIEEWFHISLLQTWTQQATDLEPLNRRLRGERWTALMQQVDDAILAAIMAKVDVKPATINNEELLPVPMPRTRRCQQLSMVTEEVDRNIIEEQELKRWSSELQVILKVLNAPILEELQMALDPDRALDCLTGSFRASTVRGYVRAWQSFQKWLWMVKAKSLRTSAADYIDYIFFRRDEPCGKTIPNTFLQAVKWIENKAGISENLRFSSSMALKAIVERVSAELQGNSPPIKRAPRMFLRISEEMESYILCQGHPVYLRCVAWIRLIKVWATLRYDCHTHIDPADIRFYEGRLTVTLRHSKTTGANKRVKELPIIVSEHAYVRDPSWLERGFELLRSIAPHRRNYLLPAPSKRWLGAVKKMASYETAASAGHALLGDLRRSNDNSKLLPPATIPFFTEHSERATAPSILATLQVPKSDRDLLGRWCPEGSDTYMRTYRTVVAKLQHRMAEALRSPTRFKDLEEHEIIPELVTWLRERAFMEQVNAEELADAVAWVMKTSSFNDEWMTTAPTQIQLSQSQPLASTLEVDSDSDELPPSASSSTRGVNQYLLVTVAGRQGVTLHNTDKRWMARSRSFTSFELRTDKPEAGEYKRVCKLCWPDNRMAQEQESSSSDSDSSSHQSGPPILENGGNMDAESVHDSEVLVDPDEDNLFDSTQDQVLLGEEEQL